MTRARPGYIVTVCDRCMRASCWHGEHPCDGARSAGTREVSSTDLDAAAREHPSNYSADKIERVTGTRPRWVA